MTKTNGFPFGRGWDHITDLNLLCSDHHAINEQFDQVTFLLKSSLCQTLCNTLTERVNRVHHACELIVMPHIGFQVPLLFCNDG